jgi:sec-independent protein translocase protein TatA
MPNIGPMELAIVLIIALVIFGPKRLPDLGRSLGSGMREFKNSVTGRTPAEELPASVAAPEGTHHDDERQRLAEVTAGAADDQGEGPRC